MGVLYEHWRLDTNECFYVGKANGKKPYERAHNLNRPNKHHRSIVRKLRPLGLVEVRTSEFPGISKEALNNLEILMIAHWKMYIGKRLSNKARGGEGNTEWSKGARRAAARRTKEIMSRPDVKRAHKEATAAAMSRPETKARRAATESLAETKRKRRNATLNSKGWQSRVDSMLGLGNPMKNPVHRATHHANLLRGDAHPMKNAENASKVSGEKHWTARFENYDRILRGAAHPCFGKPAHNKDKSQPQTIGELNAMANPVLRAKQKENVPRGAAHYTKQDGFVHPAKKDGFVHWFDALSLEEQQKYRDLTKEQFSGENNPSRKMSKEQLVARAKKGHETRRRNKEMKLAAQAAKITEN